MEAYGRTGTCFDNAVAESFWALLEEEIGTRVRPDRATARSEVFAFIESFYNHRLRRHENFSYLTPTETRQRHQHPRGNMNECPGLRETGQGFVAG